TPVLDAGLPIGAVALQLDLEELMRVTSDGTGLGESGETVLAQRDGNSALYVGPLRHVANASFRYRVALPEVAEPMRAALAGDHGQGLTGDYAGVPIIAVWRHLPALRWGMVVKMDTAEAFAPVHSLRERTLGGLALLLLTATLIALVYDRGVLASIRQLLDATRRIAAGDLEHQAELRGCTEFRELAQSFNRMAARIRHEQERLEERVAQRTEELQRSQAAYEDLTRRLPVGVYSLRGSATEIGDFTYVSDRFCELMRVPREILLADSSSAFAQVHPDAMAGFLALNCQRMSDLQPFVWEGPFLIQGRQRWFRIESLPSAQTNGSVLWNGVLSDISARKAIEEALIEAKQQAEAASRAKSDFLATMSHEIRTPLNAILGFSQLAMEDGITPRQRELLEKSHEAAHSLLGIFNDILDYAKIETGRIALERRPFTLRGLLDDLATSFSGRLADKGLDLQIDIDPDLPDELIGDPLQLSQVLKHLLGNAIKFTERGHIQIKAFRQAADDAQILLGFSVCDTGIGFRDDQVELLFQPFSQADSSITRRYGGTGLGLTISRQLVALMGGELSAQGEAGVGATFRFSVRVEMLDAQALDSTRERPDGLGLGFDGPSHAPLASIDPDEARELLAALQPILRDAGLVPDPLLARLRALAARE
ncbi:MAG: HAMP domain-containing protein, partial [Chromatiaceae bacterium]|nr:HAMP domain-containing protein [Chromatiaceae bacterium]